MLSSPKHRTRHNEGATLRNYTLQSINIDVQPVEHQLLVGVDVPVDAEGPDVLHAAAKSACRGERHERAGAWNAPLAMS
jgi:hypothetical protein